MSLSMQIWSSTADSTGKAILRWALPCWGCHRSRRGSLERQLACLESKVYRNRVKSLVRNLMNGSDQFLYTLTELAVALQLHEDGWDVELSSVFYKRKDVDVLAQLGDDKRYVDVVNLQAEPLEEATDAFLQPLSDDPLWSKVVSKVVTKYKEKFHEAIEAGWKGDAWLALDYGKVDRLRFQVFTREAIMKQDWRAPCAEAIARACPGLQGVIYFQSDAIHPTTGPLHWTPCPR